MSTFGTAELSQYTTNVNEHSLEVCSFIDQHHYIIFKLN